MKNDALPIVFWHSDPVGPDETLVISGGDFAADATVELSQVPAKGGKWTAVKPLQASEISLKAVIPASWEPGIYACRVKNGEKSSKTFFVNEPDIWWKQGDEGVDRARQGGWLRILGKCLSFGGKAEASLEGQGGAIKLELEDVSCYSLKAKIPAGLAVGSYKLVVGNGKGGKDGLREAGSLEILPVKPAPKNVINVVTELGADPEGMKDSTLAIVQATERLSSIGGGVVYFPRGRYRIDSILRSGTWIKSPIFIPEGVSFKGEGMDVVSLWWPDQPKGALPTFIDGRNDFSIEDLSIYVQGYHSTIITGSSNVRIKNVRIRANCHYMSNPDGRAHHRRLIEVPACKAASGTCIMLWGENNQILDCDILNSSAAFDLRVGKGTIVANNKLRASNFHWIHGGAEEIIFENNEFTGNNLAAGGCNIALHMGGSFAKHVYYAHNKSSHIYGGDHEMLTFDGHGSAFTGRVKDVKADSFTLIRQNRKGLAKPLRGCMSDMHGTAAYIVDGRGAGQYRWLKSYDGDKIQLESPWDIEPDKDSIISIGGFNGRHLLIGNSGSDVGTLIQLYPSNCECIVAENVAVRASNINSLGKLGYEAASKFPFAEVSWRNQFLDNHVKFGNSWGAGSTQVDRWIGGESTLNIWGWEVFFTVDAEGADQDMFMTPEILQEILGEKSPRVKSLPISRFQIVRRHKIDNSSSIRLHGAICDALVEGCDIKQTKKGVRVDYEHYYKQPEDIGQLFNFNPEPGTGDCVALPFLPPEGVLIRANKFENVEIPYSGSALGDALLVK